MKKYLLINGWEIEVDCKIDKIHNYIKQVVVRCKDRNVLHCTYHEKTDDKPSRSHITLEQMRAEKKLVVLWNGETAFTHWISLPNIKQSPQKTRIMEKYALPPINSQNNLIAFCFWIVPLDATIVDSRHIYQYTNIQPQEEHEHTEPKQRYFSILKCATNELELETLETCCWAIKREKYDLSRRGWNTLTNEICIINNKGEFEIQRLIDTSQFSHN